jgi:hypothetical protein
VRRERVAREVEETEAAVVALAAAIAADLDPLVLAAATSGVRAPKSKRCHLEHDKTNNTLWLRFLPTALAKQNMQHPVSSSAATDSTPNADRAADSSGADRRLVHPRDRHGKEVGDRWTTPRVEEALETYRVSAAASGRAVAGGGGGPWSYTLNLAPTGKP